MSPFCSSRLRSVKRYGYSAITNRPLSLYKAELKEYERRVAELGEKQPPPPPQEASAGEGPSSAGAAGGGDEASGAAGAPQQPEQERESNPKVKQEDNSGDEKS